MAEIFPGPNLPSSSGNTMCSGNHPVAALIGSREQKNGLCWWRLKEVYVESTDQETTIFPNSKTKRIIIKMLF